MQWLKLRLPAQLQRHGEREMDGRNARKAGLLARKDDKRGKISGLILPSFLAQRYTQGSSQCSCIRAASILCGANSPSL